MVRCLDTDQIRYVDAAGDANVPPPPSVAKRLWKRFYEEEEAEAEEAEEAEEAKEETGGVVGSGGAQVEKVANADMIVEMGWLECVACR